MATQATLPERIDAPMAANAMLATGKGFFTTHNCSICHCPVGYVVRNNAQFYKSACDCSWSPERPREWQDIANWYNMQTAERGRRAVADKIGLLD